MAFLKQTENDTVPVSIHADILKCKLTIKIVSKYSHLKPKPNEAYLNNLKSLKRQVGYFLNVFKDCFWSQQLPTNLEKIGTLVNHIFLVNCQATDEIFFKEKKLAHKKI